MIGHSTFKEALHPEFLRIERKRVGIILLLFLIGTIVIPIAHVLTPNLMRETLYQKEMIQNVILWWGIFCVFQLMVYLRIHIAIKKNITIPKKIILLNLFMEFGLPAVVLFQTIRYDHSLLILEYDGLIFYFLLLMLSAMHLDFFFSVIAGILAGIGYYGAAYWGVEFISPEGDLPQMLDIYAVRSIGLVMAGIVAGFVAREINKRVNNYLNSQKEQREVETLLGQQLSKDVAKELLMHKNDKVGHKICGSIMFLDIRKFTTMADHQSPEETIEFQNAIFDPLIRIIEKNNGIIHQILGDGFMASFGIAVKNENHIHDSFAAGMEIIKVINHLRVGGENDSTKVGIGLHSGEVITGNIGNEIRQQFSIAGKNVIIAARLEQMNKNFNTQFLISKTVADQLEDKTTLKNIGSVKMKGIDNGVEVLQVV
jgi:adenylate cyclase